MRFWMVLIVCLIALMACEPGGTVYKEVTEVDRVTGKETKRYGKNGEDKYLVFTRNETFENTDTLIHGKWDSSDVYGKVEVGKCYEFKIYGYRSQFMSMYRNVVTAKELEDEECEQ